MYRASIDRIVARCTQDCLYALEEQSPIWQAHLTATPMPLRHRETALRRVGSRAIHARTTRTCLYCWLAEAACLCGTLPDLTLAARDDVCVYVLILHADEWLRSTNSGHIYAAMVDAPVLIWGLPDDDAWLQRFDGVHPCQYFHDTCLKDDERQAHATSEVCSEPLARDQQAAEVLKRPSTPTFTALLLYPEEGCPLLTDVVARACAARVPPAASSDIPTGRSSAPAADALHRALVRRRATPVVVGLLDSTWGQAHRLNRHMPARVTRVGLTIVPGEWDSLFAPLRRQTRDTGVSTLEAAMIATDAVVRCIRGGDAASAEDHRELWASTVHHMKLFVDIGLFLKCLPPVYGVAKDSGFLDAINVDLKRYKRQRQVTAHAGRAALSPEEQRQRQVPPVANYCYVCDRFVGWTRMQEHVEGDDHGAASRRLVAGSPGTTCGSADPSPAAVAVCCLRRRPRQASEVLPRGSGAPPVDV